MSKSTPGEIARRHREALSLTREQVAAKAEVSLSTVARLELQGQVPNGRALVRIARALGLKAEDLLPDEPNGAVA